MGRWMGLGLRIVTATGLAAASLGAIVVQPSVASAAGTAVYVSSSGSDTGTCATEASACASIAYALGQAPTATTVYVAGTIDEAGVVIGQDLTVTQDPTAGAAPAVMDGQEQGAIFTVDGAYTVAFDGLSIEAGGSPTLTYGGGIVNNDGGTVNVTDCTFTDNVAGGSPYDGDALGRGAAIDNGDDGGTGTLTVTGSTFTDNDADIGGAIDNGSAGTGAATVTGSSFTGNGANAGGAIANGVGNGQTSADGTLTVTGSTFTGNTGESGGAVANGIQGAGSATLSDDTFSTNTGADSGGALYNGGSSTQSAGMSVNDSTFVTNSAGYGGAIYNSDGTTTVIASTFSGNTASGGGGIITSGQSSPAGPVTVAGDVFDGSCDNLGGSWTDDGYNVGTDNSCLSSPSATTDQVSAGAADLGSPSDNGGPTPTLQLGAGNPAIGLIPDTPIVADGVTLCPVSADQRGDPGQAGASCDAGAVQYAVDTVSFPSSGPTSEPAGATYTPALVTASRLPGVLSLDTSSTGCTLSSGTVTFTTAGDTCILDATQPTSNANWSPATKVSVSIPVTAAAPGAPTGVTATPGATSAVVSFTPPPFTGGDPLSGYTVTATDGTNPTNGGQVVQGSASPVTVTGLTPGDSYTFAVTATNTGAPSTSAPVTIGTAPAFDSPAAATFTAGRYQTFTISATGLPGATLSENGRLPAGLRFNASPGTGSAAVSGKAERTGTYQLVMTAGNGVAPSATQTLSLTVVAPLTVSTSHLPPAQVHSKYTATLRPSGGQGPYSWSLQPESRLPSGLVLSSAGTISGTPTVYGNFRVGLEVTDTQAGPTGTQAAGRTLLLIVSQRPWAGHAASGRPAPAAKSSQGFYIGVSGEQWRLEVTQPHAAPNTYTGTATINTGSFMDVSGIRLESGDWVRHTQRVVTFHFVDHDGIDGASFTTTPAATRISFSLYINGRKVVRSEVRLGKGSGLGAGQLPLVIRRT